MTPIRLFIASVLVAVVVVLALVVLVDRSSQVTVVVRPVPTQTMQVSVTGAVATPGVVTVPEGARLSDVASAAGGFAPDADLSRIHLAGRVGDGESVLIPSVSVASATTGNSTGNNAGTMLDINTATAEELEALPGIGEVLAGRIIDYRTSNGPFASIDDLTDISGISVRLVDQLRPLITVSHGG